MSGRKSSDNLLARQLLEETPLGNGSGHGTVRSAAAAARGFRMPLHYPRYTEADYKAMPEWKINGLLAQYGLPVKGDVEAKRNFAMGAFLWPSQRDKEQELRSVGLGSVSYCQIFVTVLGISTLVMARKMLF